MKINFYGLINSVFVKKIFPLMLLTSNYSSAAPPSNITASGDSITMAFAAVCERNQYFWDLFCLLGGDRPSYSWFDGSNSRVYSVLDRYQDLSSSINGNKNAASSGSELRGGQNNFVAQAQNIVQQQTLAEHVEVLLGGNDICNRDCVDPRNCNDPLYSEDEWRSSIRSGLDILVNGLQSGSTIVFGSVPRVQDLRSAGLEKQSISRGVRCESLWSTFGVCSIATRGGNYNNESELERFLGIESAQIRYNEIIKEEVERYNANQGDINPRGIELISEYVDQDTLSIGTYVFNAELINGGDCFHPSIEGQNILSDLMWSANTDF